MNPTPARSMHSATWYGVRSIFAPSASSTSALPQREVIARLPCLATRAPAPAAMNAAQVLTLNEPLSSPPVPRGGPARFPVLGAAPPRPGREDRRAGADVERAALVAAGAAGIEQRTF